MNRAVHPTLERGFPIGVVWATVASLAITVGACTFAPHPETAPPTASRATADDPGTERAPLREVTAGLEATGPEPQPEPAARHEEPMLPVPLAPPGDTSVAAIAIEDLPGPEHLIGLDSDRVAALLGPPGFRRRDNPAEIWQYGDESCILDLFLYKAGEAYRVTHVEVRGRSVAVVDRKACYLGLLKTRPGPKAG